MDSVERLTDVYGVALFGIWTVLLAVAWGYILYDRRRSRNATHRPLRAHHD
ncbi:hypothetical protein GALL_311950 [mine drainage metagenome]|uniref:CcmD family protein n=1 Tax=mine drainage metagenome TaxID=410659 RepID=A0A1J5QU07_9ZZZZ